MIEVIIESNNARIELKYPIDFSIEDVRNLSFVIEEFINSVAARPLTIE